MNIDSEDLVRLIVWYASSRGEKLTTLRLVKFLYLADLYHARGGKGDRLNFDGFKDGVCLMATALRV